MSSARRHSGGDYRGDAHPRAAFHIGATFVEYPSLALLADAKCNVALDKDEKGLPVLSTAVKANLGTQTRTQAAPASDSEA